MLICRIASLARPYTYALSCMSLMLAAIVNLALSLVSRTHPPCRLGAHRIRGSEHGEGAQIHRFAIFGLSREPPHHRSWPTDGLHVQEPGTGKIGGAGSPPVVATGLRRRPAAITPGTPFNSWTPWSSKVIPEPATRSFTVCDTSTSPAPPAPKRAHQWRRRYPPPSVQQLAFAGVQADADLQAEFAHRLMDGQSTADRAGRSVEPGEEPVPGRILLYAVEPGQLPPDQRVVLRPAAAAIARRRVRPPSRLSRRCRRRKMVASTLSGSRASLAVASCRNGMMCASSCGAEAPVGMCSLPSSSAYTAPGNVLGEVAPVLDLDPRVSVLMQHQRGGADGVQHPAHVDRLVHLIQGRA